MIRSHPYSDQPRRHPRHPTGARFNLVRQLRQLVQRDHQHLPLQQPLIPKANTVADTNRPDTAQASAPAPDRPAAGLGQEQALAEIAELANGLCEHLADEQWRTAERIRHLAESALTASTRNGAS